MSSQTKQEKRKKAEALNIRNRRRNITKNPTDFVRIMKHYREFYAHKFENLDEMNKFSVKHNLPKLTQRETDKMNIHASITEVEFTVASLPTKKKPGPDGIIDRFYQTFKGKR